MLANALTRRFAAVALAGLSAALVACNPPQPPEPAAPAVKISTIAVDVSALSAQNGETTAALVQTALPGQLARSLERSMAPGDPNGATLNVQVSTIMLGPLGATGAIDSISGTATLSGGGIATTSVTVDTTTAFLASPADTSLWQAATQRRVGALTEAFARWLPRKFELKE